MASLLHCLRKSCFTNDDDDDNSNNGTNHNSIPGFLQILRSHDEFDFENANNNSSNEQGVDVDNEYGLPSSLRSLLYQPPTPTTPTNHHPLSRNFNEDSNGADDDDNDDDNIDDNIDNDNIDVDGEYSSGYINHNQHHAEEGNGVPHSMFRFLQNLSQPFNINNNNNNSNSNNATNRIIHHHGNSSNNNEDENDRFLEKDHLLSSSPLRPATESCFTIQNIHKTNNHNKNTSIKVPTIKNSTVVLPGSNLQKQMSLAMQKYGYKGESEEDECVICMEGFDESNPRMPTLCACGENKTFFHLPCLYHWIQQQNENGENGENGGDGNKCPACREELTWEEF